MSAEAVLTLSDAREDFVHNVMSAMYPHVFGIIDTYASDVASAGGKTADFQRKLQEIPCWNQAVIDRLANQILVSNTEFTHLLRSLFVAFARVLIFRRRPGMPSNVRIMAPTNAKFVHAVMVHVACYIFEHPIMYKTCTSERKSSILTSAIQDATRQQLPKKELLQLYLGENINTDDLTPALHDQVSSQVQDAREDEEDEGSPPDEGEGDGEGDGRVEDAAPAGLTPQGADTGGEGGGFGASFPDGGAESGQEAAGGGDGDGDGDGDEFDHMLSDGALAGVRENQAQNQREQEMAWQSQYADVQDMLPGRGGSSGATQPPAPMAAIPLSSPPSSPHPAAGGWAPGGTG